MEDVLFIRAPGDEASTAIAAVQGISWILSTLILLPAKVAKIADDQVESWRIRLGIRFIKWCGFLFTLSFFLFPVAFWIGQRDAQGIILIIAFALFFLPPFFCLGLYAGGYVGIVVGYSLYPFLIVPTLVLMLLSGLAIGPEMTAAALARNVTVEPCPRGLWKVILLGDFEPVASKDLQHSVVYRSEEACDVIGEWVTRYLATFD